MLPRQAVGRARAHIGMPMENLASKLGMKLWKLKDLETGTRYWKAAEVTKLKRVFPSDDFTSLKIKPAKKAQVPK